MSGRWSSQAIVLKRTEQTIANETARRKLRDYNAIDFGGRCTIPKGITSIYLLHSKFRLGRENFAGTDVAVM